MSEFIQQTEALVDQAVLGKQVEAFMKTDIGKYLDARMESEYLDAVEALTDADPEDAKAVRAAQNKIWCVRSLRMWLESAIISGLKAQQILEDREDN